MAKGSILLVQSGRQDSLEWVPGGSGTILLFSFQCRIQSINKLTNSMPKSRFINSFLFFQINLWHSTHQRVRKKCGTQKMYRSFIKSCHFVAGWILTFVNYWLDKKILLEILKPVPVSSSKYAVKADCCWSSYKAVTLQRISRTKPPWWVYSARQLLPQTVLTEVVRCDYSPLSFLIVWFIQWQL